ncbi:MAG: helix-hairpin-helix domain-containing protein [Candidatus Omnitrophica bacterium]|nr:helix-hairpin-helix domain-containing protein [Candidatus Omnitrophota bacterium]
MLDFSRPERRLILIFLILGLLSTGLSYRKKIFFQPAETIQIKEKRILIDINKADRMQLERLPGIGPVLAENIISYRDTAGGFKGKEELRNVKGIGSKKFENIKDLINISE